MNADVLQDLLRAVLLDAHGAEARKLHVQLLSKATLPAQLDEAHANALLLLTRLIAKLDTFDSTALANSFARFSASLAKKYADAAEALDVAACLAGRRTATDAAGQGDGEAAPAAEHEEDAIYKDLRLFLDANGYDALKTIAGTSSGSGSGGGSGAKRPAPRARKPAAGAGGGGKSARMTSAPGTR